MKGNQTLKKQNKIKVKYKNSLYRIWHSINTNAKNERKFIKK